MASEQKLGSLNSASSSEKSSLVRILLNGGDNMLGRAVQLTCQTQSHGEEKIRDSCPAAYYLRSSLEHPRQRGEEIGPEKTEGLEGIRELNRKGHYLWGDYLHLPISPSPDLRLLNLETAVTRSISNSDVPVMKGIRYHFHVDNFDGILGAVAEEKHGGNKTIPTVITLANNHILDFGHTAFNTETLPELIERYNSPKARNEHPISFIGAGSNDARASKPVHLHVSSGGASGDTQVYIFAAGSVDSGIPLSWAATPSCAGVFVLPPIVGHESIDECIQIMHHWMAHHLKKKSTTPPLLILSIHWGPNWAYRSYGYGDEQDHDLQVYRRMLAHRLIDECGFDLIHGHSSHHIRGLELHNGKLIIYGAGDLINDYEGFSNPGDEAYVTLGALFLVDLCPTTGHLKRLQLLPTFMNRLRLTLWHEKNNPYRWDPPSKSMQLPACQDSFDEAATYFCRFINALSLKDADPGSALLLKVLKESPSIPSGSMVLAWEQTHP
eukprot:CAMPEP_0172303692 /NCGR_PEP_ID=MMETSP1058-20130122/5203_1 /TAXON_ID=83371 /ORGANISM="Detonula confervacea, Strain CCMP 353" /LENGTH=494 /DNA_ID=CAMNT_0013014625 /DNA_START=1017 /DNA_END=2501 /DNA_ORIENTATION=-